ncbi:MAG: hypothetical protein ACLUOI_39375 [Eisenbergiella sp.]
MIQNNAKINDTLSKEKKANETRGMWYYQLVKAAGRYSLDEEAYARSAIRKLGNLYRKGILIRTAFPSLWARS